MDTLFESVQVCIWDVDGTLYQAPDLSDEIHESAYRAIEHVRKWPRLRAIEEFSKVYEVVTLSATEAVAHVCGISVSEAAVLTDTFLDRMRFISPDDRLVGLFSSLRGFTHYILGNGSKSLITEGLRGLGVDPSVFVEIVTSETVGVNKPNDLGFKYIQSKTQMPWEAHLMIGDRDRVDLEPAKKLGMLTCLVWSNKPSTVATVTVPTVYEVAQILA